MGGFTDEARDVKRTGEDVSQDGSLGAVGLAEPRGAFHAVASLAGIATLGVAEATDTQLPGRGSNLEIASQTEFAIGKAAIDPDQVTEGV